MINAGGMNGYSDPAPNGTSSTNPNATTHHPGAASPDAAEDAAGDTDNDFDPLFDDESVHGGEAPASATMTPAPAAAGTVQNGNHANTLQLHVPGTTQPPASSGNQPPPARSAPKKEAPILDPVTYADYSPDIFMTASIDGQVTLWDRRAPPGRGVGRLEGNEKSPPWCVSVCMRCL
jgi:transcriptional activator SPT8